MKMSADKRAFVVGTLVLVGAVSMAVELPRLAILSTTPRILYKNTANTIQVNGSDTAALKASGAKVIRSKKEDEFVVIPIGNVARLQPVLDGPGKTKPLPMQQMQVVEPPLPTIHLIVNGSEFAGTSPINKRSNVSIRLTPDPGFAAQYPDEASYRINEVELLAQRSLGAASKVASFGVSGQNAMQGVACPLGDKLASDTPGTVIYFHINQILRQSAAGLVEVSMPQRYLYVAAVIK